MDCWGVGGLRSVENEVAPMIDTVVTSCEKDKKHKTEGGRAAEEDIKERS